MNGLTDYFDLEYQSNHSSTENSNSPGYDVDNELLYINQQGLNYELSRYNTSQAYSVATNTANIPQTMPVVSTIPNTYNSSYVPSDMPPVFSNQLGPHHPSISSGSSVLSSRPSLSSNISHRRTDSQQPLFETPRKRRRDSSSIPEDNELRKIAYDLIDNLDPQTLKLVELTSLTNHIIDKDVAVGQEPISSTLKSFVGLSRESKRQIFAIVWLVQYCELSPTSVVPRNRVYSKYASHHAELNTFPLTPANLGKLVRILYPNLTIRRLGVRGQSKYHYCGIKLVNDKYDDSSSFQTIQRSFDMNKMLDDINIIRYDYHPNLFETLKQSIKGTNFNKALELPSIYPYLPNDTDVDIADTLYALYKIHNSSMIECFRYLDHITMFNNFTNFISILTSPVFKLYSDEQLFDWVCSCDLMTYKIMLKVLFNTFSYFLEDNKGKHQLLDKFKLIAERFNEKLFTSINDKLPKPLISIKLACSSLFNRYLTRYIKFIELTIRVQTLLKSIPLTRTIEKYKALELTVLVNKLPFNNQSITNIIQVFEIDTLALLSDFSISKLQKVINKVFQVGDISLRIKKVYIIRLINDIFRELIENNVDDSICLKFWIEDYLNIYLEIPGVFDLSIEESTYENKKMKKDTNFDLLNLDNQDDNELYEEDAEDDERPLESNILYTYQQEYEYDNTFEKSFGEFIKIKQEYTIDLES